MVGRRFGGASLYESASIGRRCETDHVQMPGACPYDHHLCFAGRADDAGPSTLLGGGRCRGATTRSPARPHSPSRDSPRPERLADRPDCRHRVAVGFLDYFPLQGARCWIGGGRSRAGPKGSTFVLASSGGSDHCLTRLSVTRGHRTQQVTTSTDSSMT